MNSPTRSTKFSSKTVSLRLLYTFFTTLRSSNHRSTLVGRTPSGILRDQAILPKIKKNGNLGHDVHIQMIHLPELFIIPHHSAAPGMSILITLLMQNDINQNSIFLHMVISYLKTASSALIFFLLVGFIQTTTAQSSNVDTILEEVEARSAAVTWEQAQIKMEIINEKGKVRSRTIKSFQYNGDDEFKSLVYFEAPANVEGTALLTLREGDDQVQKLYLPAIQRIQTITGSQRGDSFMGSDFTYEDLGQFNEGDYEAELIDSMEATYEIEAIPTGESSYDRILFFIDREHYTIQEAHYFKNGTQIKRLEASDYETLDTVNDVEIRSPGKMVMHNLQSGGRTELTWSDRELNEEIDQRYFTERMLKRGL